MCILPQETILLPIQKQAIMYYHKSISCIRHLSTYVNHTTFIIVKKKMHSGITKIMTTQID